MQDQRISLGRRDRGALVVFGVAAVYVSLHATMRLLASSTLGEDDPIENLLVQTLSLGYVGARPALYDWILWAVQQVTGPRLASFLIIKYIALVGTAVLIYHAGARVLRSSLWAMLAAESIALVYHIGWRYHEAFTHKALAMLAAAASVWAMARLVERGQFRDYTILGVIAGLGIMTAETYWVHLASLILASFVLPQTRERLLRPQFGATILIAGLVASPYGWWLATAADIDWSALLSLHADQLKGIVASARGPISYLFPVALVVPIVFPGTIKIAVIDVHFALAAVSDGVSSRTGRTMALAKTYKALAPQPLECLVLLQGFAALVLSLLLAMTVYAGGFPMHELTPLYLPQVIWLMSLAKRATQGNIETAKRYAVIAAGIALVAMLVRSLNLFVLEPVCSTCRWGVPYAGLTSAIEAAGFKPGRDGRLATLETEVGGNLRAQSPTMDIFWYRLPLREKITGPVALIWDADVPVIESTFKDAIELFSSGGRSVSPVITLDVPWHHLWRPAGYRKSHWRMLIIR